MDGKIINNEDSPYCLHSTLVITNIRSRGYWWGDEGGEAFITCQIISQVIYTLDLLFHGFV